MLEPIYRNIEYYQNMITYSSDPYERLFYERQLYNERMRLINHLNQWIQLSQQNLPEERVFTALELAQYDGSNGRLAYVAVNGIVYDVSLEATWGGGTHFSLYAGKDLTNQFNGCHSSRLEILKNLPKVGVLLE